MTSPQSALTNNRKTFGFAILALLGIGILFLGSMFPKWIVPEPQGEKQVSVDTSENRTSKGSPLNKLTQPQDNSPQLSSILLRIILGFGMVLGVCLAIAKYTNRTASSLTTNKPARMRLLASTPINNRCCVYVIQVDSQRVLASVDISGLKSLTYLPGRDSQKGTPKTEGERSNLLDNLLLATRVKLESSQELPSRLIG